MPLQDANPTPSFGGFGLSFGYYDRQRTGDLMARATSDLERLRFYMAGAPLRLLSGTLMLIGVAYFVVTTDWRLAFVAVIFSGASAWRALQGRSGLDTSTTSFRPGQGPWRRCCKRT